MIIANNAATEFFTFIRQYPPQQTDHYTCLADYVYAWLVHDKGVKECGDDFTIYLQTFLLIAERYLADPEKLDYSADYSLPEERCVKRRPKRIFDDEWRVTHEAFQPDVFRAIVASYPRYWEKQETFLNRKDL